MFSTDQQTLNDLSIFGKQGQFSVYDLFNRCATIGGAAAMEDMFRHPLSSAADIERRCGIIRFFSANAIQFPFDPSDFDSIEQYLSNTDERTRLSVGENSLAGKIGNIFAPDVQEQQILHGIGCCLNLIKTLAIFLAELNVDAAHPYYQAYISLSELLRQSDFQFLLESKTKPSGQKLASFDGTLRFKYRGDIRKFLQHIYQMDAYISIGKVGADMGLAYAEIVDQPEQLLMMEDVWHPLLKNAVPNSFSLDNRQNFVFLTGANMAGKSTFMKSLSTAIYLAHMGFPVPVKKMKFTVLDGMFTTINLPDNLGMGASHFYAEVLRVKKMLQELSTGKRLFILIDELFRGTNVKDAYEGTIAIAKGFTRKKNSLFIVSTHIVEAGEVLESTVPDVKFLFLPTQMNGDIPVYSYKLQQGITDDRHGMIIIKNEGILDILNQGLLKLQDK